MTASIEGVRLIDLVEHEDQRGTFTEVFCDHWETPIEPAQWSLVRSQPRVFRGLHVHARHDEYFSVVSGRATVGLVDLRPGSSTYLVSELLEMGGDVPQALIFPRGLLHGWYFHEATVHVQAVSEAYRDYSDDDNNGCRWDDPSLPVTWPFSTCTTSARHDRFCRFDDLVDRMAPLLSS